MQFTLLTPARQLAQVQAKYVHVAGEEGDFGVLPGHTALVSTLRPGGQVKVTLQDGKIEAYTISAGVAEVSPQGVVILAESAEAAA